MPSTELDRNVLDAQFSGSASDWGQIDGQGLVQFRAGAELNRGVNLDLGLEAFANLDASFRKYVAADLTGEARGTLALKCQVQVPMNLFDEVGLAIRLQAVAELAAGASLTLGLSLRDFIALVERDPLMQGVPLRLFRIFMEEVTIGGGLYAKAALSAMAYANVVVAGSAIAPPGGKAGFNILA